MSFPINQQESIKNPQFYEQKANQLRLENQILRRQLENNLHGNTIRRIPQTPNMYSTAKNPAHYTFYQTVPHQQVIYNPVTEPIRPPIHSQHQLPYDKYPQRARTQVYTVPLQRQQRYASGYVNPYGDWERKIQMDEVEEQIIQLQARGYKLERQANRLSSYIKQDLRDFIRDSNIQKECSYKQKYLRAISNRPRYFRFNM